MAKRETHDAAPSQQTRRRTSEPSSGKGAKAAAAPSNGGKQPSPSAHDDEWAALEPTDKGLGLARLVLDKGVRTTAIGQLYGLDFEIEDKGFDVKLFFDRYNRRLKVVDYTARDYRALAARLGYLAEANDFDKIFLKARRDDWQRFLELGYLLEGILKYYFQGEDAYVLSKFLTPERVACPNLIKETQLIEGLLKSARSFNAKPLPEGYQMLVAGPEHIPQMVRLYRKVFRTYPSPLTHPDYIAQTMQRHVLYRVVLNQRGDVVSAASAEIDEANSNAELTDCATRESERGKGLMYLILAAIEDDLRERGIGTGYTLARAPSVGMNRVFHHLGYEFTGRLVNNCDIAGSFEDMNIWVKRLIHRDGKDAEVVAP